VKIEADRRDA